jgi:hypothetical protein
MDDVEDDSETISLMQGSFGNLTVQRTLSPGNDPKWQYNRTDYYPASFYFECGIFKKKNFCQPCLYKMFRLTRREALIRRRQKRAGSPINVSAANDRCGRQSCLVCTHAVYPQFHRTVGSVSEISGGYAHEPQRYAERAGQLHVCTGT